MRDGDGRAEDAVRGAVALDGEQGALSVVLVLGLEERVVGPVTGWKKKYVMYQWVLVSTTE